MRLVIFISTIVLVSAADFKEKWRFYANNKIGACLITTKSHPEATYLQQWSVGSFGADPKCTSEKVGYIEGTCYSRLAAESNDFDLSKPINGHGAPKIYGQVACDNFGVKDMDTTLVLQISYYCLGNNENNDKMTVSFDYLEKVGKEVPIKCVNGLYVHQ